LAVAGLNDDELTDKSTVHALKDNEQRLEQQKGHKLRLAAYR